MRRRRECCLYTKITVAGCPFLPQVFQCAVDLLAFRTFDAASDADFHATFPRLARYSRRSSADAARYAPRAAVYAASAPLPCRHLYKNSAFREPKSLK